MPTISRTSNPTKVSAIQKGAISIRVAKMLGIDAARTFFVEHFERSQISFPPTTKVACIATAGQTAQYFELGSVEQLDTKAMALSELATDASIRFRVVFYDVESSRILAAADNIRTVDEDSSSPSLVSIQPFPLDGPLWKLEVPDSGADDHPVLLVEEKLFSSAKAAVAHPMFVSFVLPEVVRSIAARVADEETEPSDEGSWLAPWVRFFSSINANSLADLSDFTDKEKWVDECVKAFCRRGQMALSIEVVLTEVTGEN
jgi:hypothetical protein